MAARLVSIMVDFSVKAAASILPSSVIRQQPSTPSFNTDLSTSGSLLAANIIKPDRVLFTTSKPFSEGEVLT